MTADGEFFKAVRDLCSDNGVVMIVDEVQTGMGRTGKWFGIQNYGVVPDVITTAKGLGGGLPIGAIITTDLLSSVMTPGTHGTTFGGNPLVCASGCAVIDIIKKEGLLEKASDLGSAWIADINGIGNSKIKAVRGLGLIIGIEMDSEETAKHVQKYMRDNGVLINVCHGNVIRLIPPLILTPHQKDHFMDLFRKAIA